MTPRLPHRILALDASGALASIGLLDGLSLIADRQAPSGSGLTDRLAVMLAETLAEAKEKAAIDPASIEAIAVMIGPGSFTGIRASLALAYGFGQALTIPIHGVRLTDAFQQDLPSLTRPLWIAASARRGHVFIERAGAVACYAEADLPIPSMPVALAGERADWLAAQYGARDVDVELTEARLPSLHSIAAALRIRIATGGAPIEALPLYVEPPLAKLPTRALRPAPQ